MFSHKHENDDHDERLESSMLPSAQRLFRNEVERWNERVQDEGWQIVAPDEPRERVSLAQGMEAIVSGSSVVVGISLGNSYFSKSNLSRLFRFLGGLEGKIYIVPMDLPSEHNYRALGYTEPHLSRKLRKQASEVRRTIDSALEKAELAQERYSILDWREIRQTSSYQHYLAGLNELRMKDAKFGSDLAQAVDEYLLPRMGVRDLSEGTRAEAELYVLEELAFLLAAKDILGKEQLVYLYHRSWPIYEKLMAGEYQLKPISPAGFLELGVREQSL